MVAKKSKTNKSAIAYGLFALFLGWCGVHKFYAGKVGQGVVLIILFSIGLLMTTIAASAPTDDATGLLFVLFALPAFLAVGIWNFVDFIVGMCNAGTPERIFKK